ncbi:MAG: DUF4350 domain-containing protein [Cyclobacteriaceae bacterium]
MKERRYYIFLAVALALLVLVEYLTPKPTDWGFTLYHRDKIPYGTYVLHDLIQELFPDRQIHTSYQTLYENKLLNSLDSNVLVISEAYGPDELDADALLGAVANGRTALVSANYFYGLFADTLNLATETASSIPITVDSLIREGQQAEYSVFTSYDTAQTTVLRYNQSDQPILLKVPWGQGELYLHSEPRLFTNYEMLHERRYQEAANVLSFLPVRDMLWAEYYQVGKLESGSPLRFLLSQPALRWGLYVGLAGLFLFVIFEAKRKQRAIPVYQPPTNTTLDFVSTVGNLYYRTQNHKNLADTKIAHFYRFLREHYRLTPDPASEDFREMLTYKADKKRIEVD